jgi:hypothetical protein
MLVSLRLGLAQEAQFETAPAAQSDSAKLTISSVPPGAEVYLNGVLMGNTPLTIERQAAGAYQLKLHRPPNRDLERIIIIEPGKDLSLMLPLPSAFGKVKITSEPPGAEVFVDGHESWGVTPVLKDTVVAGRYNVRVSHSLYTAIETALIVEDGKETRLDINLQVDLGTLLVLSEPLGKSIYIDEEELTVGVTPMTLPVGAGMHRVQIRDSLYEDYSEIMAVEKGKTATVNPTLIRKKGTLVISSDPNGAELILNNRSLGLAPQTLREFPTGSYILEAKLEGYPAKRFVVNVRHGVSEEVILALSRRGGLIVTTEPTGARIYVSKKYQGLSGLKLEELEDGDYLVQAKLKGYEAQETIVQVRSGNLTPVYLLLPPANLNWAGNRGSWEIDWAFGFQSYGDSLYQVNDKNWNHWSASLKWKKFYVKNLAFGMVLDWQHEDVKGYEYSSGGLDAGLVTSYYFRRSGIQTLSPYVDVSGQFHWDYRRQKSGEFGYSDYSHNNHYMKAKVALGLAIFVNPAMAIKPNVSYRWRFRNTSEPEGAYSQYTSSGLSFGLEMGAFIFPRMSNYNAGAWGTRYNRAAKINRGSIEVSGKYYLDNMADKYEDDYEYHRKFMKGSGTVGIFALNGLLLGGTVDYEQEKVENSYRRHNLGIGPTIEIYFNNRSSSKVFIGTTYLFRKINYDPDNYINTLTQTESLSLYGGIAVFVCPSWAWKFGVNFNADRSRGGSENNIDQAGYTNGSVIGLFSGISFYL